jgi:alkanesulfonate monooxygenase SsuD/methylene tetrahydromethanopterin reductase-like flavin-dependent oxidoreductase (luciferase family)
MSPEIAVEVLRDYRRDFDPRPAQPAPYSAMSVLTFASDDPEAVLDFEAGWALTMRNLVRGIREPLRPEEVRDFARSADFRRAPRDESRMVTGEPKAVVDRLRDLQEQAQVDEIVVVTPGLDRQRRTDSFRSVAEAWRRG